jgi:hypothetical protein
MDVKQLLREQRDFYVSRRESCSPFEKEHLNSWDKYEFAREVVEVIAAKLGVDLPELPEKPF